MDPERDEADVRKQGEVLKEYETGVEDELSRLKKGYADLQEFLVRAAHAHARVNIFSSTCHAAGGSPCPSARNSRCEARVSFGGRMFPWRRYRRSFS